MKKTLVVVTDLGCFKAFKLENSELHRTPRLQLIDELHNVAAHARLVDQVTDLAGRFPRGSGKGTNGAMSDGERHNIALEQRKRIVRQLATRFNQVAGREEVERCLLAASKEINHQLLKEIDPRVRAKIEKIVPADLTKAENREILRHF
jgi:hypothetical protein